VDIIDGVMLAPALNIGGKPGRAVGFRNRAVGFRNVKDKHNSVAKELQYKPCIPGIGGRSMLAWL
jgi:hypothetical protein